MRIGLLFQTMPKLNPDKWVLHEELRKCDIVGPFKQIERYLLTEYSQFKLETHEEGYQVCLNKK